MSLYTHQKCPVCDKPFADTDDVVVCPDCGTPHHRACYQSLGRCANVRLHAQGFAYTPDEAAAPAQEIPAAETPAEGESTLTQCPHCSREIEKGSAFCNYCGARLDQPFLGSYHVASSESVQEEMEIDGHPLSDVSATVVTGTASFLPKFIRNKKLSWNWAAFIFGPYYLFFRKMIKPGILFTAVSLIARYVISGIFTTQFSSFSALLGSEQYASLFTDGGTANQELLQQFEQAVAETGVFRATLLFYGVMVILHIVCAMLADSLYRKQVIKTIDTVDEQLKNEEAFSTAPPMLSFGGKQQELTQKQLRTLLLSRRGGTSFMLPLAAFLAIDLITSLITRL